MTWGVHIHDSKNSLSFALLIKVVTVLLNFSYYWINILLFVKVILSVLSLCPYFNKTIWFDIATAQNSRYKIVFPHYSQSEIVEQSSDLVRPSRTPFCHYPFSWRLITLKLQTGTCIDHLNPGTANFVRLNTKHQAQILNSTVQLVLSLFLPRISFR